MNLDISYDDESVFIEGKVKGIEVEVNTNDMIKVIEFIENVRYRNFPTAIHDGRAAVIVKYDGRFILRMVDANGNFDVIVSEQHLNNFIDELEKTINKIPKSINVRILDASHKYISEFHQYDVKTIIETIISHINQNLRRYFYVFQYPGWINIRTRDINNVTAYNSNKKITSIFKPRMGSPYNIGMFAIDLGADHYLSFILDTKKKEIWLFDSLASKPEDYYVNFMTKLYPGYKIKGVHICSGCGKFEPLYHDLEREEYVKQNIFCHTWSLWFIYQVVKGLNMNIPIENTVEILNRSCGTPRENLIRIKQFIHFISTKILEIDLPEEFAYIHNPDHVIQESRSGLDAYELIRILEKSPEYVN